MYHLAGHESCGLSQTNLTTWRNLKEKNPTKTSTVFKSFLCSFSLSGFPQNGRTPHIYSEIKPLAGCRTCSQTEWLQTFWGVQYLLFPQRFFFFFLYSFLEMFESFPLEKCNKTFYYIWEQQYSIRARVHLQGFLSISFRQMSKGKHRSSTQELTNYETGICLKCQGFFSSKNIFKDTYLQAQKGFDFILIFSIRLRANAHRH